MQKNNKMKTLSKKTSKTNKIFKIRFFYLTKFIISKINNNNNSDANEVKQALKL